MAAVVRPTTPFHLAPILVAAAVPILAGRWRPELRSPGAAVGAALATATAITLALVDVLRGPSLLPYGGALLEALSFTLVGSVAGMLLSRIGTGAPAT